MPTCARCRNYIHPLVFFTAIHIEKNNRADIRQYGVGNWICYKCGVELDKQQPHRKNIGTKNAYRNCPHCGRPIALDVNVCPYCEKRV